MRTVRGRAVVGLWGPGSLGTYHCGRLVDSGVMVEDNVLSLNKFE